MTNSPPIAAASQKALRDRVLAQRRALSETEISRRSARIRARFLEFARKEWGTPDASPFVDKLVLFYRTALPGELELAELWKAPDFADARIAFPRILSAGSSEMDAAEVATDLDWAKGPWGIPEPLHSIPAVEPAAIDLVLVPGVAFGSRGERVGLGKGFYDRFLKKLPHAVRIGLAFDFQLLPIEEPIPLNPWDERVDFVVTESRVVACERA